LLAGAALLAALSTCRPALRGQQYPSKPILMLMPLQAGSAVDVMIRIVAQKMSESMGQQILIENQPGVPGRSAPRGQARRARRLTPSACLTTASSP